MKIKIKNLLVLIMMLILCTTTAYAAEGETLFTRDEAVQWAKTHADRRTGFDIDNIYGIQCSDFGTAYINYIISGDYTLNHPYTTYDGRKYFNLTYPNGWQHIRNTPDFVPEPGDILVWDHGTWGHVAVAIEGCTTSQIQCIEQDGYYNIPTQYKTRNYAGFTGVIRPNWKQGPSSQMLDIGTNFYAVIYNTNYWKPITNDDDHVIRLRQETGSANQLWKFTRQNDGAYLISSASNGYAIENFTEDRDDLTPVKAWSGDWGGFYQRWEIYQQGNGYVLRTHHASNNQKVLDLQKNSSDDGTPIIMFSRHNGDSQVWSVYRGDEVQLHPTALSVEAGRSATSTKFSWNDVYGEAGYNLIIINTDTGEETTRCQAIKGISETINLPSGNYRAYVETYNYYESFKSNDVFFTVEDSSYAVSYDANGGYSVPPAQAKIHNKTLILDNQMPSRTGYQFTNWNTSPDGTGTAYSPGGNYSVNSPVTLYAQWTPISCSVIFDPGAGTVSPTSKSVSFNANYGALPMPVRTGYNFIGWFTASSGGQQITPDTVVQATSEHTIYAHWLPIAYTITFDPTGGSVTPETKEVYYQMEYGSLPIPVWDRHTFLGWFTSAAGGNQILENTVVNVAEHHMLFAHWSANPYTESSVQRRSDLTNAWSVKSSVHNINHPCAVLVAGYDSTGRLVALSVAEQGNASEIVQVDISGNHIEILKIMTIKNLDTIQPLTPVEIISLKGKES